ncbi:Coatomer subunit gamma [Astathelohania contejeani]|uniref:Coatomer subunit gamma n=1 Tax=Astathelohania contejeani TaxID=164912 RepID=A0ABQ7HVY3_9MICR|nr:Coatomer subunit gamma [Thelohania contejeani]
MSNLGQPAFKPILSETQLLSQMKETFSQLPLIPRKCVVALNQLTLYLARGNILTPSTARSIYFYLLRSFSSPELYLKNLIYACMNEIIKLTEEGFLGISVLTKDLDGKHDFRLKNNALKVLFKVVPEAMINDFEKYVKAALINPQRQDTAIIVCYILSQRNREAMRSWVGALSLTNTPLHDYHTLALSYELGLPIPEIKRGISAIFYVKTLKDPIKLKKFLDIKYIEDVIFIEAVRTLLKLDEEDVIPLLPLTIQSLKIMLKSPKKICRLAAMKQTNLLALKYPTKIASCNKEIEDLVADSNRALSYLAITTLLKTGTEETIDRLISQLPESLSDLSDNFKCVIIDTLQNLSLRYNTKENDFILFVNKALNEKGSLKFKRHVVKAMKEVLKRGHMRDKILNILCLYIEDSQYYQLTMDILDILGDEIKNEQKYVVHIYNRLILENSQVRCAALQALWKIGCGEELLMKYIYDEDEMVREQSVFLVQNSTNPGNFDLNELGEIKNDVVKYLGEEYIPKKVMNPFEEKYNCKYIKSCKSINLCEDEFSIILVKHVLTELVVLEFTITNNIENVKLTNGKLSILGLGTNGEKINFELLVENLEYKQATVISATTKLHGVYNGAFNYEICCSGDLSDTENDGFNILPFQINFMDFVYKEEPTENLEYFKETSFELEYIKKLGEASKRFIELMNLKIIKQESDGNRMGIMMCGVLKEKDLKSGIKVELELVVEECVIGEIKVWSDSMDVIDKVMNIIQ